MFGSYQTFDCWLKQNILHCILVPTIRLSEINVLVTWMVLFYLYYLSIALPQAGTRQYTDTKTETIPSALLS